MVCHSSFHLLAASLFNPTSDSTSSASNFNVLALFQVKSVPLASENQH